MSGRRITPELTGSDDVQSAILTQDGSTVVASVIYDGPGHLGRGTIVGGDSRSLRADRAPLRRLLAERAEYSPDSGHPGWFIGVCDLAAADATGSHLLVSCDRFGRLDHGRFTVLRGSAPQAAVAAAW
jgi:hypothetical protein